MRQFHLLLLTLCLTAMAGCTFGVRKETQVVYASVMDQSMPGIRIATNRKIPVTVGNDYSERDFGGYYIISAADLKGFIALLKVQDAP